MFRCLGGFMAFLSALLFIGVILLGVRSRHHADTILLRTPGNHAAGAAGDHGGLLLALSDLPYDGAESVDGSIRWVASMSATVEELQPIHDALFDPTTTRFSFLGFKTAAGQTTITGQLTPHFSAILIPCWFLAIVLALLPFRVFRAALTRRQRKRKGLCVACGYDLRASSGRCPECGSEIRVMPAATGAIA
jgi:hypothetical protein